MKNFNTTIQLDWIGLDGNCEHWTIYRVFALSPLALDPSSSCFAILYIYDSIKHF